MGSKSKKKKLRSVSANGGSSAPAALAERDDAPSADGGGTGAKTDSIAADLLAAVAAIPESGDITPTDADTDETDCLEDTDADEADVGVDDSEEDGGDAEDETDEKKRRRTLSPQQKERMRRIIKKTAAITGISLGSLVAAAAIAMLTTVLVISRTITTEINHTPDFSRFDNGRFASYVCRLNTKSEDIDVSEIAIRTAELEFFGFIDVTMKVDVVDTTPPSLELFDIDSITGIALTCGDFVSACSDATDVTFTFESGIPDTSSAGIRTVIVAAEDEAGNIATASSTLMVSDALPVFSAELGADDIDKMIHDRWDGLVFVDLSEVASFETEKTENAHIAAETGRFICRAYSKEKHYIFDVAVSDTVAPTASVRGLDIRRGEEVAPEAFVYDILDAAPVDISFVKAPDIHHSGRQDVTLLLQDPSGNTLLLDTVLCVYDLPSETTLELGFKQRDLERALFGSFDESAGLETPAFTEDFTVESLGIGDHALSLLGENGEFTVNVKVRDTIAPKVSLYALTGYVDTPMGAEKFVRSCDDESQVTFKFREAPSFDEVGRFTVGIIATDEGGNTVEQETTMRLIIDTLPPVFNGIRNRTVIVGDAVSFKSGVSANDDAEGPVSFSVDSSAVDTSVVGRYPVIYTASDSKGNTATATAYITVNEISLAMVNSKVDTILASITTAAMTPTEKARAIYNWCTRNIAYSTSTSHLMGSFVAGAYSGLTTRAGNCYIYYAVASAMLTRAGIENIEIQRNDPGNPHYWNLIKIDGSWWHFDTCPHYAGHALTCFMLTDAQLKAYSENEVAGYYSFDASLYPPTP